MFIEMKRVFLFASVLLLLAACTNPVYNVDDASIATGSGSSHSLTDVRRVIVESATTKGWTIKEIDATHMEITRRLRASMVQSVITYSESSFSIAYKDSANMKYNGTTIHHKYNRWVRKLEKLIIRRLVAL